MLVKPLAEIQKRLQEIEFAEEFDLIVAIAWGGIIPAVMLQTRHGFGQKLAIPGVTRRVFPAILRC